MTYDKIEQVNKMNTNHDEQDNKMYQTIWKNKQDDKRDFIIRYSPNFISTFINPDCRGIY